MLVTESYYLQSMHLSWTKIQHCSRHWLMGLVLIYRSIADDTDVWSITNELETVSFYSYNCSVEWFLVLVSVKFVLFSICIYLWGLLLCMTLVSASLQVVKTNILQSSLILLFLQVIFSLVFMPPTPKTFRGHIGLILSVRPLRFLAVTIS